MNFVPLAPRKEETTTTSDVNNEIYTASKSGQKCTRKTICIGVLIMSKIYFVLQLMEIQALNG